MVYLEQKLNSSHSLHLSVPWDLIVVVVVVNDDDGHDPDDPDGDDGDGGSSGWFESMRVDEHLSNLSSLSDRLIWFRSDEHQAAATHTHKQ